MAKDQLVEFGKIDQAADPGYFVRFLDEACAEPSFQDYKRRTFELLEIQGGERLLEVGCGTGDDVRALARLVGTRGQVVGLDNSRAMIAEANRGAAGLQLPVQFQTGDAMHLEFPADTFDGCRADRSFMHIPDPAAALAEMVRVTKREGRVLVYEVDFETLVIDAPDRALTRRVVNGWCDHFRDGWLGRHVPGLFRDVGLKKVIVIPATLILTDNLIGYVAGPSTLDRLREEGRIAAEEARAWLQFLDEARGSGRLFATLTGFIVRGQKL